LTRLDLYAILGIPKNASSKDITSAYRRLALKYHPDRNKSPFANEMMLKINTAYNILSDPIKREEYDYSLIQPEKLIREEPVEDQVHRGTMSDLLLRLIVKVRSKSKISVKIVIIAIKRVLNFINSR
jgi:curved DNA-binding protein CbpA